MTENSFETLTQTVDSRAAPFTVHSYKRYDNRLSSKEPCIHLDLFHTNNYSGAVSEQGFTKQ